MLELIAYVEFSLCFDALVFGQWRALQMGMCHTCGWPFSAQSVGHHEVHPHNLQNVLKAQDTRHLFSADASLPPASYCTSPTSLTVRSAFWSAFRSIRCAVPALGTTRFQIPVFWAAIHD